MTALTLFAAVFAAPKVSFCGTKQIYRSAVSETETGLAAIV